MKNIKYNIVLFLSIALVIAACKDTEKDLVDKRKKDNQPAPKKETTGSAGSVDFSTYIALGNSITAGFMDGALYNDGQNNSFPKILSEQLKIKGIGGGEFNQPDIESVNGLHPSFSNLKVNPPKLVGRTVLNLTKKSPEPTLPGELPKPYLGDKSKLNNFGVPGIQIGSLLTPLTGGPPSVKKGTPYNPLYARFASAPGTSTILTDALARKPTFYTLWAGNNDVLGYATTGGADRDKQITPTPVFQQRFKGVIDKLVKSKAKGVVINIPPVLATPFFRAVTWNPITMTSAQSSAINEAYKAYNGALAKALQGKIITKKEHDDRVIKFKEGKNGFVIIDPDLKQVGALPKLRLTNSTDLALLSAGAILGKPADEDKPKTSLYGIAVPINDKFILTKSEQVKIITARVMYNTIIKSIVSAINTAAKSKIIALYETGPIFADLAGLKPSQAKALGLSDDAQKAADGVRGITKQGFIIQPDFSPGGIFSTDGIHPNPKGHAVIANEIIKTINSTWGAKIPEAQLINYRTVVTTK